jgi:hypothetical protein
MTPWPAPSTGSSDSAALSSPTSRLGSGIVDDLGVNDLDERPVDFGSGQRSQLDDRAHARDASTGGELGGMMFLMEYREAAGWDGLTIFRLDTRTRVLHRCHR